MNAPDFRLDGRCALITGAGRGIGLGIAQALAAQGAAVAIQDIDVEVAESEAAKLRDQGARAIALGGDVTDLALAPRLISETHQQLGGLHILINNAAIQLHKHWLELTLDEIQRQFNADLVFPLLLCQHAAPILRQQKWGRIINLGSIQQKHANPGMLPYSTSKEGLAHMTRGLARDLAKDQITVNLIAPGWYDTYRNRNDFPSEEAKIERGRKSVPLGRVGEPQDCAGICVLLCSPAGEYITAQTIFVDGGMSAW
jgi:glucose 1-dehydrogenase